MDRTLKLLVLLQKQKLRKKIRITNTEQNAAQMLAHVHRTTFLFLGKLHLDFVHQLKLSAAEGVQKWRPCFHLVEYQEINNVMTLSQITEYG